MREARWSGAGRLLAAGALVFACYQLGALAANPLLRARAANELVLRGSGAGVQLFHNPDGRLVRAFVAGPLSAEVPVVLLHGLGAAADYWTLITRDLLKAGRTVVLLDFPGSGGSEQPRDPAGYGLRARVATVGAMRHALGLETMDLVGHSLGGWTAALYALESPQTVRRLVLLDPGGFTRPADTQALIAALSPEDRAGARRLLDLLFFRQPFPMTTGFALDGLGRNYRSQNVVVTMAQIGEEDGLLGRGSELPEGTRLIWGERDALFPIADARRLLGELRGGRLYTITAVGHDAPLEAPRVFRDALFRALELRP